MNELVIYRVSENEDGEPTYALLSPADCGLTVTQIAEKDTPTGAPFWIISADEYTASDDVQAVLRGLVNDKEPAGVGAES